MLHCVVCFSYEYDPYERPGAPAGYHPAEQPYAHAPVDEYGQPLDPYADYGRGKPAGYANGGYPQGGQRYPQEEEEDDFGGFSGYGYRR